MTTATADRLPEQTLSGGPSFDAVIAGTPRLFPRS